MSARCTAEPISWLRLERFHLGELGDDERQRIAAHVGECAACGACLARIEQDDAVVLPGLPVAGRKRGAVVRRLPVRVAAAMGALAAAAAVVLAIRGAGRTGEERAAATGTRVKGDAIAFTLVRDDGARVDGAEGMYRDGDRFKAVVTCPPAAGLAFDLVVFDTGGPSFPLEAAGRIACGNDVPLPGAFRLVGRDDETVCLAWGAGALDRAEIAARGPGVTTVCKRLASAHEP